MGFIFEPEYLPADMVLIFAGIEYGTGQHEWASASASVAVSIKPASEFDWERGASLDGERTYLRAVEDSATISRIRLDSFGVEIVCRGLADEVVAQIVASIPVVRTDDLFAGPPDLLLEEPSLDTMARLIAVDASAAQLERDPQAHGHPFLTLTHDSGSSATIFAAADPVTNPLADGSLNLRRPRLVLVQGYPVVVSDGDQLSNAMWHQRGWFWHLVRRGEPTASSMASDVVRRVAAL